MNSFLEDPNLRAEIDRAKVELAAALRLAVRFGLQEGICNHFSYAVPGRSDLFLLNPFGRHWAEMRASDILLLDAEGQVLEGEGTPELTAFCIHSRVHLQHPRARAVLHTHMPWATALTCLEEGRLLPVHQNSLRFWGEVAYDDDYNGLAGDRAEGDRIAATLGAKRIVFMANHGVMVAGESIPQAFDDLYYLERACQIQVLAMQTGRPLKLVSDNVAGMTRSQFVTGTYAREHFASLMRLLDREGEDYAA